jgi:uncharacterized protein with GYD domain
MAKYLIAASYTAEGLRGLAKDKASGRQKAVAQALFVVAECPDNVSAAALSFAVSSTGLVRTKTIPLLTVAEADEAIGKAVSYRGPGA